MNVGLYVTININDTRLYFDISGTKSGLPLIHKSVSIHTWNHFILSTTVHTIYKLKNKTQERHETAPQKQMPTANWNSQRWCLHGRSSRNLYPKRHKTSAQCEPILEHAT